MHMNALSLHKHVQRNVSSPDNYAHMLIRRTLIFVVTFYALGSYAKLTCVCI